MLRPGNVYQDFQAMFASEIEKPGWRNIICAKQVGAQLANLAHIGGRLFTRSEHFLVRVGSKRAIGHPFDEKPFSLEAKKFPVCDDAERRCRNAAHNLRNLVPPRAWSSSSNFKWPVRA